MPPLPALRCSPARETKMEQHKRGLSLESMIQYRDRDDDLALFQDMQTKERDNFLHPSADDSDESLSIKLRGFSDFRLSITTPVRRDGDLLTADADKNDYDWLLTPPETPLFPSLDEDTPVVNLSQRGRPRSQPIRISRASRTETSSRATRSSASPRRSSPSSCSSSINTYSRGRASSAPNASVSPTLRSLTPSVRPSTPTTKLSTPSVRSTTPTLRRSSTGSSSSVGRAGPSGKASRGSSSSPKLQSWHSNIPGFAADPPPNLRTSISDRPVSHARGSSPASRRGGETTRGSSPAPRRAGETGNGSRRQSISPTVSRSASSSNSHDRDRFSSQSKGSVVSSCEDEMDSVQSAFSGKKRTSAVGMVGRQVTRKQEPYPNSRVQSLSKKPTRSTSAINVSAGSAPKRSFDSALRQMDLRRNSQSMFRPLLSSAPATSFYVSKANSLQRRTYSMNSSVTTSSNASSEQGASVAPDTEGSDHDHDDLGSEWEKSLFPHVEEEVFVIDKMEVKSEDAGNHSIDCARQQPEDPKCLGVENIPGTADTHLDAHDNCDGCEICEIKSRDSDNWNHSKVDISGKSLPSVIGGSGSDCHQNVVVGYTRHGDHLSGMVDSFDSQRKEAVLNGNDDLADICFVDIQEDVPANNPSINKNQDGTRGNPQVPQPRDVETGNMQKFNCNSSLEVTMQEVIEKQDFQSGSISLHRGVECESRHLQDCSLVESTAGIGQAVAAHGLTEINQLDAMSKFKGNGVFMPCQGRDDSRFSTSIPSQDMLGKLSLERKAEISHGSAASVELLSRANSVKGPVLQAKIVNAVDLPGEDSHVRGSLNELKNFVRYEDNASTSQVSDAGSTKQTETRVLRQTSCRKLDTENFTNSTNMKVPFGVFTSTTGVQSETRQIPVYSDNAILDSFIDVFESKNGTKFGSSEHTAAAAEGPIDAHQIGGSETVMGKDFISISLESVSPLQDDSLVTEMDAKMQGALALETANQEHCCPLDAVSKFETQDQRCGSIESSNTSENECSCFEQVGDAVAQPMQGIVQPREQDKESIGNDCNLLSVRADCCSSDVVVSIDDNSTQEGKVDNLHDGNMSSQTEAAPSLAHESNLEMQREPSALATQEEYNQSEDLDIEHPDPDCCKAEHINVSQGEHKADAPRGYLSRSLTLEEATDTILFCSSIVHSLAYKAATIAMEKENLIPVVLPRPTVTILGKSEEDHRNSCGAAAGRHTSKFQKIKSRQTASHLQAPSNKIETSVKDQEAVMHVVSIPERGDTVKPPNINSKCNCTVM